MRKPILILLAVFMAVASCCVYWYWTQTPTYSLYKLRSAVVDHDFTSAMQYVDIDRIGDDASEKLFATAMSRYQTETATNPFSGLGVGMLAMMKPTLAQTAKASLKKEFENCVRGTVDTGTRDSLIDAKIISLTRNGREALAVLKKGDGGLVHLRLARTKECWSIIEIGEITQIVSKLGEK